MRYAALRTLAHGASGALWEMHYRYAPKIGLCCSLCTER
jgi:hypothetical protein